MRKESLGAVKCLPVSLSAVLESAVNIIIDDYLLVSEAESVKEFEIRMTSIGTYACLIWNPGDGSSKEMSDGI